NFSERHQNDVGVYAVDYPASLNFDQAALGVIDARNKVASIAAECSDTRIVVGGYSQGAAVAGYTTADAVPAGYVLPDGIVGPLPVSVSSHVAAVVLFGTPSESFLHLVDRNAPPIVISGQWTAKTLQLCAPRDPVCSSSGGFDRAAHGAYQDDGSTEQAADFVASQLSAAPAAQHV
ncbi:cutinase family protein, partial [Mycobacterium sp. AT1]|uniref:cutinase family protein n=1 Tax=Mycobacterium sp. AT1 TaxID=1961706 RepID=UPI0009C9EF29